MRDFTEGNATRQIIAFSLPMLIGNVFQQVYSMVDAVVVGRYVGGAALAAVGISMNLLHFLLAVLIGLTTGASVVISQYYGAGRDDMLERTVSTSILFLGALSAAVSLGGVLGAPLFLRLLGSPADVLGDAALYLRILMGGMLFPILYNMYTAYLRALGDSRGPLYILVFSTLLNTALDLFFVVRLRMGVGGVAAATVIAQTVSAALCFLYARRRAPLLRVSRLVFDRGVFRSILRYSVPAALQLSLTSLATLTITRLVNSFGSAAMAGYTAALKIDQLALMPLNNVSMAVSTFVGQNMGAGLEDRAKRGLRSSLLLMCGVAVFISLFILLYGRRLIALFVDASEEGSPEIIAIGARYLSVIVSFYIVFAVFFAFNGFFRGAGDAVIVMALTVTSLTIRSASAHLLVRFAGMGPEAVAWSIPIGWCLCSLAAFAYYKKRLWAGKTVASPGAAPAK